MKKVLTITCFALLIFLGCKEKEPDTPLPAPEYPTFSGITSTDLLGVVIGAGDSTDWTLNDTWVAEEKALFADINDYAQGCPPDTGIGVFPVFPNPDNGVFTLSTTQSTGTRVAYRIVDQNFNLLSTSDSLEADTLQFNLPNAGSPTQPLIRMYYMFVVGDSCAYLGHGDYHYQQ